MRKLWIVGNKYISPVYLLFCIYLQQQFLYSYFNPAFVDSAYTHLAISLGPYSKETANNCRGTTHHYLSSPLGSHSPPHSSSTHTIQLLFVERQRTRGEVRLGSRVKRNSCSTGCHPRQTASNGSTGHHPQEAANKCSMDCHPKETANKCSKDCHPKETVNISRRNC